MNTTKESTIKRMVFGALIYCFLFILFLSACGNEEIHKNAVQDHQNGADKCAALIIFVQSDLNINDNSDSKIFQSIRENKISDVIKRSMKICPEISLIEIYPLYAKTSSPIQLGKANFYDLHTKYEKEAETDHLILVSKNKYRQFLNNSTGSKCQDIIGAYYFLRDCQDRYKEYSKIRVVFISDMIHYLASVDDYKLDTENITFRSLDCLESFKKQIIDKKIKTKNGYNNLQKLFDGQKLTIWTVKPEISGNRVENVQTSGFDIDNLWRMFFIDIGASEVKLNM